MFCNQPHFILKSYVWVYQDDLHRLAHFRDLYASSKYQRGKYVFENIVKKGTEITDFLKCLENVLFGCYESFGRRFGRFRQFFGLF